MAIIEFIRNPSFGNSKIDSPIFSRLKIQKESRNPLQDETKFDHLRDELLGYLFNRTVLISLLIVLVILACFVSAEIGGMFLIGIAMIYIYILYYPQIKDDRSYSDMNRELPYALRHMSIELKSGKGLHDSMLTIRNADYGSLSREFNRVLEEVKFGSTLEDSLIEMVHRVNSEGLSRSVHQIIGTLRVGGNLSSSLEIIAKDISFDMQIKLKDYSFIHTDLYVHSHFGTGNNSDNADGKLNCYGRYNIYRAPVCDLCNIFPIGCSVYGSFNQKIRTENLKIV